MSIQRYEERIQRLSQTVRVSTLCMDAGFKSVEVGQYFMTKENGEQFYAKACREFSLPRNDGSSKPKGWIQGKQKMDPCWKLRPVAYMVNTELKLESGL